ncbi:MAG: NAD-dependent epimerase/dehydratase family protein [Deltaproteobacteria bacterium]|nr:NAD-dependent epimerase/dehydratase family protein [Deltaproteobacteria bacterium]
MKSALVIGGSRFFGKRLVALLLERGVHVSLLNRAHAHDPFEDRVERLRADRTDAHALEAALGPRRWDVVFDNICYAPDEAADAVALFDGRVQRYVHTSTQSVYETFDLQREEAFDPWSKPIRHGARADFDYGEAKRLAEAVYFQTAKFPVAAVRIPIVLGPDDYTGRLEFHLDRVRSGAPIVVPNLEARTSFISSDEAARFLEWTGRQSFTGPINACSEPPISIGEVLALIEKTVGKKARVERSGPTENHTPFVDVNSRYLDSSRARELGFQFSNLRQWLPDLIRQK